MIKFDDLRDGFVATGDHHAFGAIKDFERSLTTHGAETVGDDVFKVEVFQTVQNTRISAVAVLFNIKHGAEVVDACRCADDEVACLVGEQMTRHR